jgi:hypothetical protein
MKHWEIILQLIEAKGYKSYLEIGCDRDTTFNRIRIERKAGVDPIRGGTIRKTSDEFFKDNKESFDIIFIDGLHIVDQVERDILNALDCLNDHGTIVVHDLLPENELMQKVPRQVKEWTGNGWIAWAKLKSKISYVFMAVVDTDYGCGLITSGRQNLTQVRKKVFDYQYFCKNKNRIMNIISVEEFKRLFLK